MNVYEWCNLLKIAVLMYELLPILCNSLKIILILHLLIKQPPSVIFLVSLWRLLKTQAQVCWNVWASFGTVNSNVSNNLKVQAKRCCLTELQIHVGQPVSVMQGLVSKDARWWSWHSEIERHFRVCLFHWYSILGLITQLLAVLSRAP